MRVILVGPPSERARLRARLESSGAAIDVVGEAPTTAAAEALDVDADAYVVAAAAGQPSRPPTRREQDEDVVVEPLTPREIEVLQLLAEGLPNKGIAARLGISDQTVKFHVASICGKLGASNRTEAVRRAVRRGLIAL